VGKSIKEWLSEGEGIYDAAMREYQELEAQIIDLEQKLGLKREEVNMIAEKLGRPAIEASKRLSAEIIERGQQNSVPNSPNTIAKALTGRGFGR
jgi:hypothetical protein